MSHEAYQPEELLTQGNTVMVFRDILHHLDDYKLQQVLTDYNFDPDLFTALLTGQHTQWTAEFPQAKFPQVDPVEFITIRETVTPDGKIIEDTQTTQLASFDGWIHLKDARGIGFEAILVTKTEPGQYLTYRFPRQLYAVAASVYVQSEEEDTIQLNAGDLIIIPDGTGRETSVTKPVDYTYFGRSWGEIPPTPALSPVIRRSKANRSD